MMQGEGTTKAKSVPGGESVGTRLLETLRKKPFGVWVIFGSLAYFGIGLVALLLPFALRLGFGDPLVATVLLFSSLSLLAASLVLRERRWSFVFALALCVVMLLLFSSEIARAVSNPAQPDFWFAISSTPALVLALVFSALFLLKAKAGIPRPLYIASPYSGGGLATFAVVGFVVGSVIFGNVGIPAAVDECSEQAADVCIVRNASLAAVQEPFAPKDLSIGAGETVRWVNGDAIIHTVTSDAPGAFGSGDLGPGDLWEFTFTTPGTYAYHCTPHSWMTGTVRVT